MVFWACLTATPVAGLSAPLTGGQHAPAFTEPLSTGGTLSLSALRGKAVYLNFFATWCPPCNVEAPAINALQKKYGRRGLVVVGVDEQENTDRANAFRSEYGLLYKIVVDDGKAYDEYGVVGLPVHVFIDRRGTIRVYRVGEMSKSEIDAAIKSLLRAP